MNKKMKPFNLFLMIGFVVVAALAVYVFSNAKDQQRPKELQNVFGPVAMWGTFPLTALGAQVFSDFNAEYEGSISLSYTYIPPDELDQRLLEALADGTNPDVVLLPNQWLNRNQLRIAPISYDPAAGGISLREFRDAYAQGGEIFLYPEGIMAVPLAIDPLVMYWNRDLFANAGISTVPKYWKDFLTLAPKLTKKVDLDITQSAVAMGEFENVESAKDILALLFLQVGNPITKHISNDGGLVSALQNGGGVSDALRYYTDFVNPRKTIYTWNRSLPNSQDAFLANDLAVYFDFASAYAALLAKNPRLNADIAAVPQTDGQLVETTFGRIHGLAVLKKAKNPGGAVAVAKLFSGPAYAKKFTEAAGIAPMRRDLLASPQSDPAKAVFYDAALKGRSWLDPNPVLTDGIFSRMVDDVTSGKFKTSEAINQASRSIDASLKRE